MNILQLLQALMARQFPSDPRSTADIERQVMPYVDQVVQAEQNEWARRRDAPQMPQSGGHDPYGDGSYVGQVDRAFGVMPQNNPQIPNPARPSDPGWSANVSTPAYSGSINQWQTRQANPAMTSQRGPAQTPARYNSGDIMDRMQRLFGQ